MSYNNCFPTIDLFGRIPNPGLVVPLPVCICNESDHINRMTRNTKFGLLQDIIVGLSRIE